MKLNPAQQQAVNTIKGPLLLLAGAGSGKTRVIVERIINLVRNHHILPENILAVTFTNKAAREMAERLSHKLGKASTEQMIIATFHKLCLLILKKHGHLLGYTSSFSIYNQSDQKGLVKSLLKECGFDEQMVPAAVIQTKIGQVKNKNLGRLDQWQHQSMTDKALQTIYPKYQDALKNSNAMDFDDILINALELLQTHPTIAASYQDTFRYIFIDEYQDTNSCQFLICQTLAAKYQNICVVGDDDQSIYSWRGADMRNILEFEHHYPKATVIRLEQNYRSTDVILEAANAVIKNNHQRKIKTLWTTQRNGAPIHVLSAQNERDEAEQIADEIQKLCFQEKRPYSHFALLYRTNSQSRIFEDALRKRRLPYHIIGSIQFYDRKEIKDFLGYLKVMLNPQDEVNLLRIINYPTRGIGPQTLKKLRLLIEEGKASSLYQAILKSLAEDLTIPGKNGLKDLVEIFTSFQSGLSKTQNISKMVQELEQRIGLKKSIRNEMSDLQQCQDKLANLDQLFVAIDDYQNEAKHPSISGFLDQISLLDNQQSSSEDDKDKITLFTLHSAKGLEFPIVFLVGFEEKYLPHQNSIQSGDIEEERRLCYVGITRAQTLLYLSFARHRKAAGARFQFNEDLRMPSRFLDEIPEKIRIDVNRQRETPANADRKKDMGRDFFQKMKDL